jgi:hypothetical protein
MSQIHSDRVVIRVDSGIAYLVSGPPNTVVEIRNYDDIGTAQDEKMQDKNGGIYTPTIFVITGTGIQVENG